jgi:hypothetical protein
VQQEEVISLATLGERDLDRADAGDVDALGAGEGLGAGHVGSFGNLPVYVNNLISAY